MELSPYLRPLRRWWWLIVVGTLLAGASAYFVTRDAPQTFVARATLIVGPSIGEPSPTTSDLGLTSQLAQVYADLAARDPVKSEAEKALGLVDLPDYTVDVLPDSRLLEITVTDTDPRRAAAVANELASQLIAASPEGSQSPYQLRRSFIDEQLASLEANITDSETELETAQARLATLKSAVEIDDAQAQITALESKLASLQSNYASLLSVTSQGAPNSLSVVEPAVEPTVPIGFSRNMLIALAVAIGLALSVGTTHLLELVDDRIHGPEDVERLVDWKLAGLMSTSPATTIGDLVEDWNDPDSSDRERARLLTNLAYSPDIEEVHSLVVAGLHTGKSSGHLAAALAGRLAESGKNVVLIDACLRGSDLKDLLGLEDGPGLASLAEPASGMGKRNRKKSTSVEGVAQPTELPMLDVVGAGDTSGLGEFATSVLAVGRFLEAAGENYDLAVIYGAPILDTSESVALCHSAGGVLITIDTENARKSDVRKVARMLDAVGANVIGVAINQAKRGVWRSTRAQRSAPETMDESVDGEEVGQDDPEEILEDKTAHEEGDVADKKGQDLQEDLDETVEQAEAADVEK